MTVTGDDAKRFNAVRLDSFAIVNSGELIAADEATGAVRWKDRTGTEQSLTLGSAAIRIVSKAR